MAIWGQQKIVVRDYYVSFEPLGTDDQSAGIDLSQPVAELSLEDPIYAVITGRPAGLINFLREFVGLSRRFEFVLSKSQVIVRLGSLSVQELSLSKLRGLNTITVGLIRPVKAALFVALAALLMTLEALHVLPAPPANPANPDTTTATAAPGADDPEFARKAAACGNGDRDACTAIQDAGKSRAEPSGSRAVWWPLAIIAWIYAAFLFFVSKKSFLTISEAGKAVVGFVVSPSLLERKHADLTREGLNNIAQLFRVLKDS
ncbi:MAG: hypothetical protein KGN34_11355 [Sphingomonadales bacterium]|nr:hypothetical protein [Sphingomonadales bacterium]